MTRRERHAFAGLLLIGLLTSASTSQAESPPAVLPAAMFQPEQEVLIKIRLREFNPPIVTLQRGRKTRLVFQNLDSELHAFVPKELFNGVNFNLSGNGAPEFTDQGFKRVIIPADGRIEIRFVPDHPGTFPYLCDMPGHEMKAIILVQEQAEP